MNSQRSQVIRLYKNVSILCTKMKTDYFHKLVLTAQQHESIVMMLLCFDVIEQKTVFLRGRRCIIDNKEFRVSR